MSSTLLQRTYSRGITKAEHDALVEKIGRPYTDPFMYFHRPFNWVEGGLVPPKRAGHRDSLSSGHSS